MRARPICGSGSTESSATAGRPGSPGGTERRSVFWRCRSKRAASTSFTSRPGRIALASARRCSASPRRICPPGSGYAPAPTTPRRRFLRAARLPPRRGAAAPDAGLRYGDLSLALTNGRPVGWDCRFRCWSGQVIGAHHPGGKPRMITIYTRDGGTVAASGDLTAIPANSVWFDLEGPTSEEIELVGRLTGITVPTFAMLSEIESSSRLRVEDGAIYLSAPLIHRATQEMPQATPVGFVLTHQVLITVRFEPLTA